MASSIDTQRNGVYYGKLSDVDRAVLNDEAMQAPSAHYGAYVGHPIYDHQQHQHQQELYNSSSYGYPQQHGSYGSWPPFLGHTVQSTQDLVQTQLAYAVPPASAPPPTRSEVFVGRPVRTTRAVKIAKSDTWSVPCARKDGRCNILQLFLELLVAVAIIVLYDASTRCDYFSRISTMETSSFPWRLELLSRLLMAVSVGVLTRSFGALGSRVLLACVLVRLVCADTLTATSTVLSLLKTLVGPTASSMAVTTSSSVCSYFCNALATLMNAQTLIFGM